MIPPDVCGGRKEQAIAQITDVPEQQKARLAPPISAGSRDEVETLKTADVNIQTQSTCTLANVLNVIREEEEEVEGVEEEEVEEDCLICAGDHHKRWSASSGFPSADLYIHLHPRSSNLN